MTDLARCKLCQCEPFVGQSGFALHPVGNASCPQWGVKMTTAEWTALMGVDRDAVRYRWLREQHKKHLGLTICAVGMYDLVPWSGDDPDSAIDSAMGEQQ